MSRIKLHFSDLECHTAAAILVKVTQLYHKSSVTHSETVILQYSEVLLKDSN